MVLANGAMTPSNCAIPIAFESACAAITVSHSVFVARRKQIGREVDGAKCLPAASDGEGGPGEQHATGLIWVVMRLTSVESI